MNNREDELGLGAKSPANYDSKREVGSVFDQIANATKKKIKEKPEMEEVLADNAPQAGRDFKITPSNYFVIDIETYRDRNMKEDYREHCGGKIGNLKDPIKIKEKKKANESKFALSPMTGEIILVGFLDNNGKVMQIGLDGSTEKVILQDTWRTINTLLSEGYRMVSYNGKKFDLPYLFKRALINGIVVTPAIALNQLAHKYNSFWHYDCFNVLGEEGSLERWNYLFGYGTDFLSDGHNIAEYFDKKEFSTIMTKNLADIRKTGRIYELLKGWVIE